MSARPHVFVRIGFLAIGLVAIGCGGESASAPPPQNFQEAKQAREEIIRKEYGSRSVAKAKRSPSAR